MLRKVYQTYAQLLADRFKERDENVKCAILETFRTLLKSSILSEANNVGIEHQLALTPSLVRARSSVSELKDIVPFMVN